MLKHCLLVAAAVAVACIAAGCQDLATEVAREAADRQAQQNETMAELQQEVATGTRRLIDAEAEAREQLLGAHEDLQTERSRLQSWWQSLFLAQRSESLLVAIMPAVGKLLLVAVLIGFCWYVLFASHHDDEAEGELNDVLLTELTADWPQFSEPAKKLVESSETLAFLEEEAKDSSVD